MNQNEDTDVESIDTTLSFVLINKSEASKEDIEIMKGFTLHYPKGTLVRGNHNMVLILGKDSTFYDINRIEEYIRDKNLENNIEDLYPQIDSNTMEISDMNRVLDLYLPGIPPETYKRDEDDYEGISHIIKPERQWRNVGTPFLYKMYVYAIHSCIPVYSPVVDPSVYMSRMFNLRVVSLWTGEKIGIESRASMLQVIPKGYKDLVVILRS